MTEQFIGRSVAETMGSLPLVEDLLRRSRVVQQFILNQSDLELRSYAWKELTPDGDPALSLTLRCFGSVTDNNLTSLARRLALMTNTSIEIDPQFIPKALPSVILQQIEDQLRGYPELKLYRVDEKSGVVTVQLTNQTPSTDPDQSLSPDISSVLTQKFPGFSCNSFITTAPIFSAHPPKINLVSFPGAQINGYTDELTSLAKATPMIAADILAWNKSEVSPDGDLSVLRSEVLELIEKHQILGGKVSTHPGRCAVEITPDLTTLDAPTWDFLHALATLPESDKIFLYWRIKEETVFKVLSEEIGMDRPWNFELLARDNSIKITTPKWDRAQVRRIEERLGMEAWVESSARFDKATHLLTPQGERKLSLKEAFAEVRTAREIVPAFLRPLSINLVGNFIHCRIAQSGISESTWDLLDRRLAALNLPIIFETEPTPRKTDNNVKVAADSLASSCGLFGTRLKHLELRENTLELTVTHTKTEMQSEVFKSWLELAQRISSDLGTRLRIRNEIDRDLILSSCRTALTELPFDIRTAAQTGALVITTERGSNFDVRSVSAEISQQVGRKVYFVEVPDLVQHLSEGSALVIRPRQKASAPSLISLDDRLELIWSRIPNELNPRRVSISSGIIEIELGVRAIPSEYKDRLERNLSDGEMIVRVNTDPSATLTSQRFIERIIEETLPSDLILRDLKITPSTVELSVHDSPDSKIEAWAAELTGCFGRAVTINQKQFSESTLEMLNQFADIYRPVFARYCSDDGDLTISSQLFDNLYMATPTLSVGAEVRVNLDGRRDLTSEPTLTIDRNVRVFSEDAISVSRLANGNFQVGVHFIDASEAIPFGSRIENILRERVRTIYRDDGSRLSEADHFIPDVRFKRELAFTPGEPRAAISFLINLTPNGKPTNGVRIERTVVKVGTKLSFDEFPDVEQEDSPTGRLCKEIRFACESVERYHQSMGRFTLAEQLDGPIVIAPLLELAKVSAGDFIARAGASTFFRALRVPTSGEIKEISFRVKSSLNIEASLEEISDPIAFRKFLARLPKAQITKPLREYILDLLETPYDTPDPTELHYGFGGNYVELAALRGYKGLITQYQLSRLIRQQPPIERSQVDSIFSLVGQQELERRRESEDRRLIDRFRSRLGEDVNLSEIRL